MTHLKGIGIQSMSQIPFSLQPNVAKLLYFKLRLFYLTDSYSLKYLRSTTSGCKDMGPRKSEFVAKTQFFKKKFLPAVLA